MFFLTTFGLIFQITVISMNLVLKLQIFLPTDNTNKNQRQKHFIDKTGI